jgi:hypothetical protein
MLAIDGSAAGDVMRTRVSTAEEMRILIGVGIGRSVGSAHTFGKATMKEVPCESGVRLVSVCANTTLTQLHMARRAA